MAGASDKGGLSTARDEVKFARRRAGVDEETGQGPRSALSDSSARGAEETARMSDAKAQEASFGEGFSSEDKRKIGSAGEAGGTLAAEKLSTSLRKRVAVTAGRAAKSAAKGTLKGAARRAAAGVGPEGAGDLANEAGTFVKSAARRGGSTLIAAARGKVTLTPKGAAKGLAAGGLRTAADASDNEGLAAGAKVLDLTSTAKRRARALSHGARWLIGGDEAVAAHAQAKAAKAAAKEAVKKGYAKRLSASLAKLRNLGGVVHGQGAAELVKSLVRSAAHAIAAVVSSLLAMVGSAIFSALLPVLIIVVVVVVLICALGGQAAADEVKKGGGNSEIYVQKAEEFCADDSIGYSQANRNHNPDMDCSSFVWYSMVESGYLGADALGGSAFTTYNEVGLLENNGFTDVTDSVNIESGEGLERGDILWRQEHTEIFVGDGQKCGAHSDRGYPAGGDQTGTEVSVGPYAGGWEKVLRPPAGGGAGDIEVPDGLGDVYTWEYPIDSPKWAGYCVEMRHKWEEAGRQSSDSIPTIDGRYLIACTSTFGQVGDKIDFYLDDGTVIPCIMFDTKNQNDPGCTQWGHDDGHCVLEFMVMSDHPSGNPGSTYWMSQLHGRRVASATNLGESIL